MSTRDADRARVPESVLETALEAWEQAGGRHLIPITGSSMLPLIRDGDHVLVVHGCAGVRRGDVAVFRQGGTLVAHRVLKVQGGDVNPVLVTKGDNTLLPDPPISGDEVLGLVRAIRRGEKQMTLDNTTWRALGWLVAITSLAWSELYSWLRRLKRRFLGTRPHRLTNLARRAALAIWSGFLKITQAIFGRWQA